MHASSKIMGALIKGATAAIVAGPKPSIMSAWLLVVGADRKMGALPLPLSVPNTHCWMRQ